jgi:MscS family membrane protein
MVSDPLDVSPLFLVAQSQTDIFENITFRNLTLVLASLALAGLLLRYLARLFNAIVERQPRARFMIKLVEPVIRIVLWFGVALFAIQLLAPSQDAFRAALGSAAIAIGLGAQDLVKNLAGGLMVVGDRPYQIGDRVKIGNAYGEIDHIGLQSTKLTTPDDTRVTIPNAQILTNLAFNSNSGVPDCQVLTDVFLPPDTDPALALKIGKQAVLTSPFTYLSKPTYVLLIDSYTETPFLTLRIKGYVYDHRYEPAMQSDITLRCKLEFMRLRLLESWKEISK